MHNKNPLKRYIKQTGLSYDQFASLLTKSRGWPAYVTHVWNWAHAKHPGHATKAQIEKATRGKIKVSDWPCKRVGE
jgi:hypothetical protein